MKSNKKFLFIFVILFFSFRLFGLNITFSPDKPEFCLSADLSIDCPSKLPSPHLIETLSFNVNASTLNSTIFICNSYDNFDITLQTNYAPKINNFNFGINTIFHSEFKYAIYKDIDILSGLYFSNQFSNLFYLEFSAFFTEKISSIQALHNFTKRINTISFAFNLDCNFTITDFFNCGLKIASFNNTKFNSFFTPFYTFYGNYDINNSLSTGVNLQFLYIDMFTLSANLKSITVTSFIKWYF